MKFKNRDIQIGDHITYNVPGGNEGGGFVVFFENYHHPLLEIVLLEIDRGFGWSNVETTFSYGDKKITTSRDKKYYWIYDKNWIVDCIPTETIKVANKPEGGYCKGCNYYNKYQEGQFLCWTCKESSWRNEKE